MHCTPKPQVVAQVTSPDARQFCTRELPEELLATMVLVTSAPTNSSLLQVQVDNDTNPELTIVRLEADSWPGLLSALTGTFSDLGLEVLKATVDGDGTRIRDTFELKTESGGQLTNAAAIENVTRSIEVSPSTMRCHIFFSGGTRLE